MAISIRYYLFLDDGSLRRIPQRIANELPFGRDAIPEFAGTRQRTAHVVLELQDAKPVRILDARGSYFEFDDVGRVDEHLRNSMADRMDLLGATRPKNKSSVVDLVPEIKRRELDARDRWTLTADDLDKLAADLWPGVHGPAPEVTTVKGVKPRKPPLTHEGRWALQRIEERVNAITVELGGLSERALKGLAFEAMRMSTLEDKAIWRGVADEAKRSETIRAAHRTGRGDWYAVVEVSREDRDHPHVIEQLTVAHVKCASRKEAIEAGRKLMAEKVGWLDGGITVEVTLRSALEWRPEDWE